MKTVSATARLISPLKCLQALRSHLVTIIVDTCTDAQHFPHEQAHRWPSAETDTELT